MSGLFFQLLVNGLVTASLYALAGVSWGIIYRTTRIFHFSHNLVFSVAGFAAALATSSLGCHWLIGLMASVTVAVILGCAIDALLYRTLRRMGATQTTTFLASLGLGTAGIAILLLIFSSNPRPLSGFPVFRLAIGPACFTSVDVATFVGCWLMVGLLLLFLAKSKYGKAIRAVGSNAEMARNLGIDSDKIYLIVFAIGSGLFGFAAFFLTAKTVATPTMGILPFFMSFTAVFLGGVNSLPGHALAGLLLGLAESLGMLVLPGEYKIMIVFAILLIVILIKPEGLVSVKRG